MMVSPAVDSFNNKVSFKKDCKNKVTLHTHITTSRIDSPMDELILTFMTGLTKYENTIRTARLKNGRFIRAKQGYWALGNLPFGYRMGKNKKLAIDKEQSEWVERIFKWYSEGLSPMRIKRIAKDLHIGVGTVYKVLDKGA